MNQPLPSQSPSHKQSSATHVSGQSAPQATTCVGPDCHPAITKVRHFLHMPLPHPHRIELAAKIVGTILFIVVASFALGKLWVQQAKYDLAIQKAEATTSIDSTATFGRVILNKHGKIVSWNKGMTILTGFTSAEMRNHSLAKLEGYGADPDIVKQIGVIRPYPWLADGMIEIKNSKGEPLALSVNIRDTADDQGNVKFRYLLFDQMGAVARIGGHYHTLPKASKAEHNTTSAAH